MKTYNKKVLEATKKIKNKTYSKAMEQANKAINSSPKVLYRGVIISGSVGFILWIAGGIGLFFKSKIWGWSLFGSGMILVVVNFINLIGNIFKRNN